MGCNTAHQNPEPAPSIPTQDYLDQEVKRLGATFARLLEQDPVRRWLADQLIDANLDTGYPEVLLKDLVERKWDGTQKFIEPLSGAFAQEAEVEFKSSMARLLTLVDQVPNLYLGMPLQLENWEVSTLVPEIAVENLSREYPTDQMLVFAPNGIQQLIPLEEVPVNPTLLLGFNERTDAEGNFIPTNVFIPNPDWEHLPSSVMRGNGEWFQIRIAYLDATWKDLDERGWFNNEAEIDFFMVAQTYSGVVGTIRANVHKSTIKDHEWHCLITEDNDPQPFTWHSHSLGDYIIIQINEDDNDGDEVSNTYGYEDPNTGIEFSTTVTTKENDEALGVVTVHKTDPEWSMYSTGQIRIYLKGNYTNGNNCL